MNKTSKEIMCLKRLEELTNQLDDVLMFLRDEGLINDSYIKKAKLSPDCAKEVQLILSDLKRDSKLQMLNFNWSLLPIENISLYIVTDRNSREFVFNG
jgi:hypothetical protein